ncbi:MAG: hypothetical protein V4682_03975 [Patescibacteria group bacterium]
MDIQSRPTLRMLHEQGKIVGKQLIQDDDGLTRSLVTLVEYKKVLRFFVSDACVMTWDTDTRSWNTQHLDTSSFVFVEDTCTEELVDGVIAFDLSVSGRGYLLPAEMEEIPLYV